MSARRLRVGVVGLGQWGRHHARVFSSLPGVDLVGVVDRDEREAQAAATRHGTVAYGDHRDLVGKVDAVSIVVPTVLHYTVARDFVDAGVHVLLEKPMAATVDEARRLVELNTRRGTVMLVGHVERFKPAVQRLHELIREPLYGQIKRGLALPFAEYDAAMALAREGRRGFADVMSGLDLLVVPSSQGEAPKGQATGMPYFNRNWSLLHTPCVHVPHGSGPHGLPIGFQVVGRIGDDARMLACAHLLQQAAETSA